MSRNIELAQELRDLRDRQAAEKREISQELGEKYGVSAIQMSFLIQSALDGSDVLLAEIDRILKPNRR